MWLRQEIHIPKFLLVCKPAGGKPDGGKPDGGKPAGGKCSVGAQKRQWNDMIMNDLKKYELYPNSNWREQVQDRSIWRGWIDAAAEDLNEEMEVTERTRRMS